MVITALICIGWIAALLGFLAGAQWNAEAYDRGYKHGRRSTQYAPYRQGEE